MTIVIPCGRRKASTTMPARLLYVGSTFKLASRAAIADGRPWVILSALRGFLDPDEDVAPYDHTVTTATDYAHLVDAIRRTAHRVTEPVESWVPARYTAAMRGAGIAVESTPLAGLSMGFQRAWLSRHITSNTSNDLFEGIAP